ncbi:MAG: glycosyltransferase family 4 protein [Candidatus Andersenbacteria bacterium]
MTKNFEQALNLQQQPLNVIYISSYIPRKCGIATYTKDLTNAINLLNSYSLAEILVINDPDDTIEYPWEAKFKMTDNELGSYLAAAEYVNQSRADLVSLQHEFGLFGGEGGEYIVHFVEALERPLITTFHTIVENSQTKYGEILKRIAAKSQAIVVMMENVAQKLVQNYGIPREKIVVIPHGVPDLPFNSVEGHKKKRQLTDRLVLGNINLLSPNKGIEYALEAVALIAQKNPRVLYTVIGQTHPNLLRSEGEQYRNYLKKRARELGIKNNVRFVNSYLPLKELIDWLKTLDIYITPYLDPEQVTSGALAYAIGAGKACISTPYIYAREVLADERGIIVPFKDPHAIAAAVIDLWQHPDKRQRIEKKAYQYGRLMTWPNVAQSHLNLFRTVLNNNHATQSVNALESVHTPSGSLPPSAPHQSAVPLAGGTLPG